MKKAWFTLHIIAATLLAHHFYLHVTGSETSATLIGFSLVCGVIFCVDSAIHEIGK